MAEIHFCLVFWILLGYFGCLRGGKKSTLYGKDNWYLGCSFAKLGEQLSTMMRSPITELDKTVMLFFKSF